MPSPSRVSSPGSPLGEPLPTLVALRALGLGDLLTAVPALRALVRAYPGHRRVLVTPVGLAPLVGLVGGWNRVVDARGLEALPAECHGADLAVNLHGRGPESHRLLLATRPGRMVAFAHPSVPESREMPPWVPDEHEVGRWCRLVAAAGAEANPNDLDLRPPWMGLSPPRPDLTIIHPGGKSPSRRWPAERWGEVAAAERAAGRQVLVTGTAAETRITAEVVGRAGLPPRSDLGGQTTLLRLVQLVSSAGRVLCADTGVGHLATALRVPSVVLFGPSDPAVWGPPPDRWWHRVVRAPDGDMPQLDVSEVLTAVARLPSREAVPVGAAQGQAVIR